MDLKLNTFNKEMSTKEREASTFFQSIRLEGPIANDEELTKAFVELMDYIHLNYVMDEECIYRLIDEICTCGHKLSKKDVYEKEINLPGGSSIFLKFYRYSCSHCKKPVDRKLSLLFEPNKQYSKNIKSDAVRLYSKHLSSYEIVRDEINKIYKLDIDKKTIISWLKESGFDSEQVILADDDFSGHILYDEEYMKVFSGLVGVKGSKLERIQVYLLLFRDAITKKVIIRIVEHLDENTIMNEWINIINHLKSLGVEVKAWGTDGLPEYANYINKINKKLNLNISHVYDEFHFKKNLYESANEEINGIKHSKKELPEHVMNQIKSIESFFETSSKKDARKYLDNKLIFPKNTFIKSLRHHIIRLEKYFDDYTFFFEIPQMKTTNLCEGWFKQTKPEKLKKGYKTMTGLKTIANMIAVRINYDWKNKLRLEFDVSTALEILLGVVKTKYMSF
jgi:transposase-like protein